MKVIESDAELRYLHRRGTGLIYNDFSEHATSGAQYNVLHAATCRWVPTSTVEARQVYFATISEATAWLALNRGAEGKRWRRCKTCQAEAVTRP